jgi:hypothetical protein
MRVKESLYNRGNFLNENGKCTQFWVDVWLGETSFAHQYQSLHNIVERKSLRYKCFSSSSTEHRFHKSFKW